MTKLVSKKDIKAVFKDGQTVMVAGFADRGAAVRLIDTLVDTGVKDLTVIMNDSGDPGVGVGKLARSGQVKKFITTHIGKNPEVQAQVKAGQVELELVPQGNFIEKIRCGGAGIGGVLLKTGLGTMVEEGKEKIIVDGEVWLLEKPLVADVALIKAHKADTFGNLVYRGVSRNINPVMVTAGKTVVVEAEEIVPVGTFDVDEVMTPGVFVDMILDNSECE